MERKNNYHKYALSCEARTNPKVDLNDLYWTNEKTLHMTSWPIRGQDPEPSPAPSHYLMWSAIKLCDCHNWQPR